MPGKETPLQAVKRLYGTKEKLVDSIASVFKGAEEEAAEARDRLLKASNAQLLRLAGAAKTLKEKYGSRDKLVGTVSSALGKAKDKDYVEKLKGFSVTRLL